MIDSIAIVGGGSAGWLCATFLARHFHSHLPDSVQVTLIEAEEIGTIGVGEATIPSIRKTLKALGVEENAFMKATSATFKQAIRFDDWLHLPDGEYRSRFYHTFQKPPMVEGDSMAPYWILSRERHGRDYVDFATTQGQVCEAGLGPYLFGVPQQHNALAYAYHFDATRFAAFLKAMAPQLGIRHRVGLVEEVIRAEDGRIDRLCVKDQEPLKADLYVDCTGFAARLIEKSLGSAFLDQSDVLFCDRAVTVQVPHDRPDAPIRPFTTSTAKPNGWIWDIGLAERRGVGYVHSSRYTDEAEAEAELMAYVGEAGRDLTPRLVPMRVGYREDPWVANCIAVGLAGGFIEPLESTGIHQVEIALNRFVQLFSRRGDPRYMAAAFNRQMTEWFELTFDFIKLHYCLTRRDDSAFWIDNRDRASIPDRLRALLDIWRTRPTHQADLGRMRPTFGPSSYHQVLFGLDHIPDLAAEKERYPHARQAEFRSSQIASRASVELSSLPEHRDLIDSIYASAP